MCDYNIALLDSQQFSQPRSGFTNAERVSNPTTANEAELGVLVPQFVTESPFETQSKRKIHLRTQVGVANLRH
jgi:hypothetical protein